MNVCLLFIVARCWREALGQEDSAGLEHTREEPTQYAA